MTPPGSASKATDVFTPAKRSAVMARVKSKDTRPELLLRRLLTGLGARYRLHRKDLPGSPDVAMPGRRLAIFVHGCFWHGHDCARGSRVPKANRDYWLAKVARNMARDARNRADLAAAGWRVETVWECEMKDQAALKERVAGLLNETSSLPPPDRCAVCPPP
ncbi:very short patch repair endonuclease [Caulobacter rhizosphaerae]|jgi:DNA mismatch endonuclease (patch repair protein)|uniref:very short patch repair endonuclease n=1 Tax=Caulobacter rhizosphaerae TaxID=2010972 RepID=UPI0013D020C2|nr:DNA mismatch endonuclease Vsr [Caulobacter rhizosphaerae]GGL19061.1 very short patch repair endonuclease [Caulobacter rhizosphaerae]